MLRVPFTHPLSFTHACAAWLLSHCGVRLLQGLHRRCLYEQLHSQAKRAHASLLDPIQGWEVSKVQRPTKVVTGGGQAAAAALTTTGRLFLHRLKHMHGTRHASKHMHGTGGCPPCNWSPPVLRGVRRLSDGCYMVDDQPYVCRTVLI